MGLNSPLLEKYPGLGIDYEAVSGSERIVNVATNHAPEPTEETTVPTETAETLAAVEAPTVEAETAPFPLIPMFIAFISLVAIICLIIFMRKKPE